MFNRGLGRAKAKRPTAVLAAASAIAALLAAPAITFGSEGLLDGIQRTTDALRLDQLTGRPAPNGSDLPKRLGREQTQSQPRQTPGSGGYQPPLHGANPHGQGTVGTVDLTPSGVRPLPPDPSGGAAPATQEEIVVGRARGEQGPDGQYRGHITVAALFGREIVGVDTPPGQTRAGPLDPVQTGLLDALCNGSAQQVCLEVLRADSATTGSGSTNSFAVASARVGGANGIGATAAESNGNISQDANCQTSTGNSQVAGAQAGGRAVADVASSSSSSQACRDGTQSQNNGGRVIGLGGAGVPLPAAGCGAGTPDTGTGVPGLLPIVCNANDSNGAGEAVAQAVAPYGVREALTVFALDVGGTSLLKATTGASESRAQAPAAPAATPPPQTQAPAERAPRQERRRRSGTGDDGDDGSGGSGDDTSRGAGGPPSGGNPECSDGIDNDGDGKIDFPADPNCESRDDDSEAASLPFTGMNLLMLTLMGLVGVGGGLALRKATGSARN